MAKKLPRPNQKNKQSALSNPQISKKYTKLANVDKNERKPSISLKYIDLSYNSFEDLRDNHNLKHFDAFINKLNKTPDWETVFRDFQKAPSDDPDSQNKIRSLGFDPVQTEMFHFRVTQKFRVHGFYYEGRFKMVWLDPNHRIQKE